jgi:hypothetical protein
MRVLIASAVVAIGAAAATAGLARPAVAGPDDDSCKAALSPLCSLVPAMPDLDHDIDLTQDQTALAPGDPAAPPGADHPDGS